MAGPARLYDSGKYQGALLEGGLFDYQEAAVHHCIEKLKERRKVAVLGLGPGLGKNRVAREVLIRLHVNEQGGGALVFCPSGLVSQTAESYRCEELTVTSAETGKQLLLAATKNNASSVLVVNAALRWKPQQLAGRGFLVIDEAHTLSPSVAARCLASAPDVPLLLLSAEPHLLADLAWRSPLDSRHVNPQSQRIRMEALWKTAFSLTKTPALALAIGAALPRSIFRRHAAVPSSSYSDFLAKERPQKEVGGCSCCGLCPSSLRRLHDRHQQACLAANLVCPPWSGPPMPQGVRVMLASFESRQEVLSVLKAYPPSDERRIQIVQLTSSDSSANRARAVLKLTRLRLQMTALKQAKGSLGKVLRIGSDWFINELWGLLFPALTVLVADRSCDLGYDLHRVLDAVWISHPPSGPDRLNQIVGRISRANAACAGKNRYVGVVMDVWEGTLDEVFSKHCCAAAAVSN